MALPVWVLSVCVIFGCAGPVLPRAFSSSERARLVAAGRLLLASLPVDGAWTLGPWSSRVVGAGAQWLRLAWCSCPRHMESSQTRGRTCVLCIGRWARLHSTTREEFYLLKIIALPIWWPFSHIRAWVLPFLIVLIAKILPLPSSFFFLLLSFLKSSILL